MVTFSATIITDNIINEKNEIVESKKKNENYTDINSKDFSFTFLFKNGKIKFDVQEAKKIPIDSDLRKLRNLWSGKKIFIIII